jgi:hypothetical protein
VVQTIGRLSARRGTTSEEQRGGKHEGRRSCAHEGALCATEARTANSDRLVSPLPKGTLDDRRPHRTHHSPPTTHQHIPQTNPLTRAGKTRQNKTGEKHPNRSLLVAVRKSPAPTHPHYITRHNSPQSDPGAAKQYGLAAASLEVQSNSEALRAEFVLLGSFQHRTGTCTTAFLGADLAFLFCRIFLWERFLLMSFLGLSVSSDLSGRVVDGVLSVWGGRGGPEGAGHVRTFGVERLGVRFGLRAHW